jgi:DNA-binding response OmpR family regulator
MQSVLVVEDDLTFAQTVEAYLTRAGFDVDIAKDTMVALNMAERRRRV